MKSSNQKNENILTRKTEIEEWKKKKLLDRKSKLAVKNNYLNHVFRSGFGVPVFQSN